MHEALAQSNLGSTVSHKDVGTSDKFLLQPVSLMLQRTTVLRSTLLQGPNTVITQSVGGGVLKMFFKIVWDGMWQSWSIEMCLWGKVPKGKKMYDAFRCFRTFPR
jgi:hypothetical protein